MRKIMKKFKKSKGYGAFEYSILTAFVIVISLIILSDTKGAVTDSSQVVKSSFMSTFGVSATP